MKLNFNWENDGTCRQYCANCHAETVEKILDEDKTYYYCTTCSQRNGRSIVIDPAIKWWVAKGGEYWHESAGIFVRNPTGKFLFFERRMFPFAMTVPAGHVDAGEEPGHAAIREAKEEVGLIAQNLKLIADEEMIGDSCRRGSDAHYWHAYLLVLDKDIDLQVTEHDEGEKAAWLTLDQALERDLTFPVRRIISQHAGKLMAKASI